MEIIQKSINPKCYSLLESVMLKASKGIDADPSSNIGYFEKIKAGVKKNGDFFSPSSSIYFRFDAQLFREQKLSKKESRGYQEKQTNPLLNCLDHASELSIKCLTRYKANKLSGEIYYATQFGAFSKGHKHATQALFIETGTGRECMLISTIPVLELAMKYHLEACPEATLSIQNFVIEWTETVH